jgi:hypothetical protein
LHRTQPSADWITRDVWDTDGQFQNLDPLFGDEIIGDGYVQWGVAQPDSFASYLKFQNAGEIYPGGQLVTPGGRYLAGRIEFGNGRITTASSAPDLTVDLALYSNGLEFDIDNHFFDVFDTVKVAIRQTPNSGDPYFDADFIYFPDLPRLGSFRVREGRTKNVNLWVKFGSIIPESFELADDGSDDGFLSQSITDNPFDIPDPDPDPPAEVPEPSSLVLALTGLGAIGMRRWRRAAV